MTLRPNPRNGLIVRWTIPGMMPTMIPSMNMAANRIQKPARGPLGPEGGP